MPARLSRVDAATTEAVLADVARYGPYFTLATEPATRPSGTDRSVAALYGDGGDLDELIDDYATRMGGAQHRVAASILFLGWAARLFSPALGAVAHGMVPDLDPDRLRWWPATPFGLRTVHPGGWRGADVEQLAERIRYTVIEANLGPLAAAVRGRVRLAEGLLWGNTASALVGSLQLALRPASRSHPTSRADGDEGEGASVPARAVTAALLRTPPLRGTTTPLPATGPPEVRRRSCCLYYRVPAGGGLCGDCALDRVPQRASR